MELLDIIEEYLCDNKEGRKNLITCILNGVIIEEAARKSCNSPCKRTNERKAHRNGFKQRTLKTKNGTVTLSKPKFRE